MANNCYFRMKVVGMPEHIKELIDMLTKKDKYQDTGLGGIYFCEIYEGSADEGAVELWGECAWSVATAMIDYGTLDVITLPAATEKFGLTVEVYSEELGMGFQEHYLVENGKIIIEECVDCEEYYVQDMTADEKEEFKREHRLTEGEIIERMEEGYVKIGGFERWDFRT